MNPAKKRRIRLSVTLALALLLATALIYTSFSAATPAKTPSQLLLHADPTKDYDLTGKVVSGSIRKTSGGMTFSVRDRVGSKRVPVSYSGTVPDPFRDGREVIVTGKLRKGIFVGEPGSLITKCPSKFTKEA